MIYNVEVVAGRPTEFENALNAAIDRWQTYAGVVISVQDFHTSDGWLRALVVVTKAES